MQAINPSAPIDCVADLRGAISNFCRVCRRQSAYLPGILAVLIRRTHYWTARRPGAFTGSDPKFWMLATETA